MIWLRVVRFLVIGFLLVLAATVAWAAASDR
jgi:hypothetical protein